MDMRKTTGQARRVKWQKLIVEAARSGNSMREFCRLHGVPESQFYAWRARLNGKLHGAARRRAIAASKRATFALVSDTPGELDAGIELILADGRRVRIRRGVDEQTLRTVLAAVGTGPC